MFTDAERAFLERGRVGRLATADGDSRPHVVPVCYALVGTGGGRTRLVTPVDEKPKQTTQLRRVRDVEANPQVALVVDRYDKDWSRLAWVQVRGRAAVLNPDAAGGSDADHAAAVRALRRKYNQYADHALGERPILQVDPGRALSWGELSSP